MNETTHVADSFRRLQLRLDRTGPELLIDAKQIAFALVDLAACLETWCCHAVPEPGDVLLSMRGGALYDPLDLLKDVRQRSAFQLRILAEESRALRDARHHEDYLERVRSFANHFQ